VAPGEVIGIVEAVATATVPVVATVLGEMGPDRRARIAVTPSLAEVRGRAAIVDRAVAVVAALPVGDALSATSRAIVGYAVDAAGRPLADVAIAPGSFAVDWQIEPVWVERRVPMAVAEVVAEGWSQAEEAPSDVALLGPPSVLAALERVVADVELPTEAVASGRYTRPLRPRLTAGVVALEAPIAALTYTDPAPPPEPDRTP
jgi:YbbR domain-containing protein